MRFLIASEFPEKVDWKRFHKWLDELDLDVDVTLNCKSRKEFDMLKKKVKSKHIKKYIAWPVLPKKRGYWYSGFLSKKDIDTLDAYKDVDFRVDFELPFPNRKYSFIDTHFWGLKHLIKYPPNKKYMQDKLKKLSGINMTVVSYPFPKFILRRFGWTRVKNHAYMFYSAFLPKWLRPLYRFVFAFYILFNKDAGFSVGPIGPGIFGNEPSYGNVSELETDLKFLKKQGVDKMLIFELSAITKRGKEWLEVLKDYS